MVDPERFSPSNLERMHGAYQSDVHAQTPALKVEIMRRMISAINPRARTRGLVGNVLHDNVLDELLMTWYSDALTRITAARHGGARHYLLPALDVGVLMEGRDGRVTNQVVNITRYAPSDPCAFCRGQIDSAAMAFELMSEDELAERARPARKRRREEITPTPTGEGGRVDWSRSVTSPPSPDPSPQDMPRAGSPGPSASPTRAFSSISPKNGWGL